MLFHTILSRFTSFVLCSLLAKTRSVEYVCGFVITSIVLFSPQSAFYYTGIE